MGLRTLANRIVAFLLLGALYSVTGCETRTKEEAVPPPRSAPSVPQSFADLTARVSPAVVNISTTSTVTIPGTPFDDFFGPGPRGPFQEFFQGLEMPERQMRQQSLGSGVMVTQDGYIVTNNITWWLKPPR